MLLEETHEGIVQPCSLDTKLLGAVNRESVTCYLDALLFAMFVRLDSFEAMLYDNFDDVKRKKLAGLLRLWVNLLRTGKLITTDLTKHVQEALADCGWKDAAKLKQQDPSEAFTFITGQLGLPLLTLKMDLYHTGKEDTDDHKFVNERLLEVAIVEEPAEGNSVVTLEDCLEHYFNNRIEVKRHIEETRRRNTLTKRVETEEKMPGLHVEVAELLTPMSERTDILQSPSAITPVVSSTSNELPKTQVEKLRPIAGRKRADSIFSQRKVNLTGIDPEQLKQDDPNATVDAKGRKMSTRTEVLMPAWQFFKLLPWYTNHMPTSDAQVAAHFSKKRPVLGICLKRYSYTNQGQARRLNTYIDIPLEIAVPNFVSDDNMEEDGPLVGNFRLLLQSVVCHRGVSVHSGHYITLCRGQAINAELNTKANERRGSESSTDEEDQTPWMRFDDLSKERVSYVNIHQALKQESPYLLFYQVQPIGDDGHSIHDLPSYAEATSRSQSDVFPAEKPLMNEPPDSGSQVALVESESASDTLANGAPKSEAADFAASSGRQSLDINTALEHRRGRSSVSGDERRQSIAFDEASLITSQTTNSIPGTPSEEKNNSFLNVASKIGSRRGSRVSKANAQSRSTPASTGPDQSANRFSLNMSKLTQRMSKGDSAPVQPSEAVAAELAGQTDAEKQPAVVTEVPPPTTQNREHVTAQKPLPKARKDKSAVREDKKHKHKHKHKEDRDCVVM